MWFREKTTWFFYFQYGRVSKIYKNINYSYNNILVIKFSDWKRFYVDAFIQWGFTKENALKALKETDYNFDLALDVILNY